LKLDKDTLLLYVVTDREWVGKSSFEEQIEETLKGGATFLQLREKNLSFNEFLEQANKVKKITDKYKVPFLINDNVEVAMESNADGVHIGQGDMNAKEVRALIGDKKVLGVTASTVITAKLAEADGADYIGVGAVFKTNTKEDAEIISMDTIKDICKSVSIPVVAIGGIDETSVLDLKDSGIDGICCISAIFAKENIYEATKNLYNLAKEVI
jgi:thiamine-phosphate pyrophosphorylase